MVCVDSDASMSWRLMRNDLYSMMVGGLEEMSLTVWWQASMSSRSWLRSEVVSSLKSRTRAESFEVMLGEASVLHRLR